MLLRIVVLRRLHRPNEAIQFNVFEATSTPPGMEHDTKDRQTTRGDPSNPEKNSRRCAECHRNIEIGEDAVTVERVVMGPRGPVPIDDMRFFHISRCLAEYVCSTESENLPKRIP